MKIGAAAFAVMLLACGTPLEFTDGEENDMINEHIIVPPTWITPTMQGYAQVYGGLAYSRDQLGWVTFRGAVYAVGPGATGVLFSLPAGSRPASDVYLPVVTSAGGTNYILISASTGDVSFPNGLIPTGCWITLSACRFLAEQ